MRITLLHPPHTAIGSRIPKENLPPFGLLCIGGPLIDRGHDVTLINGDLAPLGFDECVERTLETKPDIVLIGHSGSSSAHPTVKTLSMLLKRQKPGLVIVYGGVYPTYHWRSVLSECPQIDFVVRGEGEETTSNLIAAIQLRTDLE